MSKGIIGNAPGMLLERQDMNLVDAQRLCY